MGCLKELVVANDVRMIQAVQKSATARGFLMCHKSHDHDVSCKILHDSVCVCLQLDLTGPQECDEIQSFRSSSRR